MERIVSHAKQGKGRFIIVIQAFAIFPEGSLSESVVTTVWIGVLILTFFNLRFGWGMSGLVVPGYLVPLLILRPISVAVILAEALITYSVVWFISKPCSRIKNWSSFFGRDRFFLIVLVSVLVRTVFDGYLLPALARSGTENGWLSFNVASNLHGFGLIIVALMANQFWKPGLKKGLCWTLVTTGVTYLIVRFILLEFTNLTISNLVYMYEDMSSSVLSSPKAYIIVLISAFIASKLNFHYSWDFNGILLPSLLALQWYDPMKIVTSFLEAWVIYAGARLILRMPFFQEKTIEGSRKLLLFFNLSFFYKFALGHICGAIDPYIKVVDCYGFGYLLPTLLAIKMYDKRAGARITRATIQASMTGVAVASIVGFMFTLAPEPIVLAKSSVQGKQSVQEGMTTLIEQVRRDKMGMYGLRLRNAPVLPGETELQAFESGLKHVKAYMASKERADIDKAAALFSCAHHEVHELEKRYLYVREASEDSGLGIYIFDLHNPDGVTLEVPAAIQESFTMESGVFLMQQLQAGAAAVVSQSRRSIGFARYGSLVAYRTFFNAFHKVFRDRGVLQVRGYTTGLLETLYGLRVKREALDDEGIGTSLWVTRDLPKKLHMGDLKRTLGSLGSIQWQSPDFKNIQRANAFSGFAELFLSKHDRRRLLARFFSEFKDVNVEKKILSIDGYLQEWILKNKDFIAERGKNSYRVPAMESLLLLDEEGIQPLIRIARKYEEIDLNDPVVEGEIKAVNGIMELFGYSVKLYIHTATGKQYLLLTENGEASRRRHWGIYVFRVGKSEPHVVEIPRPLYERNTYEYGVHLFERLDAGALLVAGAHPRCNLDRSSDVILLDNKQSFFQLVHQAVLRGLDGLEVLVTQVRACGRKPGRALPASDMLVSFIDGSIEEGEVDPAGRQLLGKLREEGSSYEFVKGSPLTAGYEPYGTLQAKYMAQTKGNNFATLWLSPLARFSFRRHDDLRLENDLFASLGISTVEAPLFSLFQDDGNIPGASEIPEKFLSLIRHFQKTRDINAIARLASLYPGHRPVRIIDENTQKTFLVFRGREGLLPMVARGTFNPGKQAVCRLKPPLTPEAFAQYVESSAAFLFIERES